MTIEKRGLIYCPKGEHLYDKDSFMTPNVLKMSDGIIRIWGGVRDDFGRSRIICIDVDENDPKKVLHVYDPPALDIGKSGCFDDNGVILGDIILSGNSLYMYYVGFQHVEKVKFFAFTGLAISNDGGITFSRYSEVPVMDRSSNGRFGRCIHTVLWEDNVFKIWYAIINDWIMINGISYPVYDIWYTESKDGIHFSLSDSVCCIRTKDDEYRIGRPKVYRTADGYEMFYTRDTVHKEYIPGYAISKDGINWERRDDDFRLLKSDYGWDSQMTCYPVKLNTSDKTFIFYNGNGMGKTGVGYAEIV